MSTWRAPSLGAAGSWAVLPTDYGADPTGVADSSAAFAAALAVLLSRNTSGHVMSDGIVDLQGAVLDLAGGEYLLSAPLRIPQFVGNLRIIDGTLRAASDFPVEAAVLEVGAAPCVTPSGQGSCNENVGMSGLTVDASHVAAYCIRVSSVMGATLDSSSALFGFATAGLLVEGGHEVMVSETWVAAYFWSDPRKAATQTTGILLAGNDHVLTNVIIFSARVGVHLTGAANLLSGVHTWNQATGKGGVGIQDDAGHNRYIGCYLDYTDLVLTVPTGVLISSGFFLGGAQLVFAAPSGGGIVDGVVLSSNVWSHSSLPPLAVNETLGAWRSVTALQESGTALAPGQPRLGPSASLTVQGAITPFGASGSCIVWVCDFAGLLLFPHAPIVAVSHTLAGALLPPAPSTFSTGAPIFNSTGVHSGDYVSCMYEGSPQGVVLTATASQSG